MCYEGLSTLWQLPLRQNGPTSTLLITCVCARTRTHTHTHPSTQAYLIYPPTTQHTCHTHPHFVVKYGLTHLDKLAETITVTCGGGTLVTSPLTTTLSLFQGKEKRGYQNFPSVTS